MHKSTLSLFQRQHSRRKAPKSISQVAKLTPTGTTRVRRDGTVRVRRIEYRLGSRYAGQVIYVEVSEETVAFIDCDGVIIAEHPWPLPDIAYIGAKQLRRPQMLPMS